MFNGPMIIGGPSRCGKTTLLKILNNEKQTKFAGLPVEGLLKIYARNKKLHSTKEKKLFINEYLKRQRNISEIKSEVARPIDYFKSTIPEVLAKIPKNIFTDTELLNNILKIYSQDMKKEYWCVCDTHPEFYFEKIKKYISNLKLIVLIRDPREALCAGLYWRTFPNRSKSKSDSIPYRLSLWILSIEKSLDLIRKFPNDVGIVFFNSKNNLYHSISDYIEIGNNENFNSAEINKFFSYKRNKFLSPDGKWESLINSQELSLIEKFSINYLNKLEFPFSEKYSFSNNRINFKFTLIINICKYLSKYSFPFAKSLLDWYYVFPIKKFIYSNFLSKSRF